MTRPEAVTLAGGHWICLWRGSVLVEPLRGTHLPRGVPCLRAATRWAGWGPFQWPVLRVISGQALPLLVSKKAPSVLSRALHAASSHCLNRALTSTMSFSRRLGSVGAAAVTAGAAAPLLSSWPVSRFFPSPRVHSRDGEPSILSAPSSASSVTP